jgi:lipid II isoglutaminyl synthase (glutamine-hydrolysing)
MPRPASRRTSRRLHLRDAAAAVAARLAVTASRLTGRAATSIPGVVAESVSPGVTARIAGDLGPVVLVTGTNGKTSTARFLTQVLESSGREVIANRSGANLEQAVASALVASASMSGRLRHPGAGAVFEVDEAALSKVARRLPVSVIVMTNLFRDQLDRFGETDFLVRSWTAMLEMLPAETVIVWCADDPRLAAMVGDRPGAVSYGMVRPDDGAGETSVTGDVSACPVCSAPLAYEWTAVGHLGAYACASCGLRRPEPVLAVRSQAVGVTGQTLGFRWQATDQEQTIEVPFPTLGNAYNAAAAAAAASVVGVSRSDIAAALARASAPFARFEEIPVDGRRVVLSLVKNPASFGELIRLLSGSSVESVLFVLSDRFQDGRDVSWYWDMDPAPIVRGRTFAIAGRRALDFEVRLRHELVERSGDEMAGYLGAAPTPAIGLERVLAATPPGGTCFVLSTYTELLALRATLVDRGLTSEMPR